MNEKELIEFLKVLVEGEVGKLKIEIKSVRENINSTTTLSNKAIDKAEVALTRRLEAMNELRDQLREQAENFARKDFVERLDLRLKMLEGQQETRAKLIAEHQSFFPRFDTLEQFQSRIIGFLIFIPLITAIISAFITYLLVG